MGQPSQFFLGIGISGIDYDKRIIPEIRCILTKSAIDSLAAIATFDTKRQHPLVEALAQAFTTEVFSFSAFELETQKPFLTNPDTKLYARLGCHSVAEAAALAAAGEGARLVIPKTICHKATFALAVSRGKEP